MKLLRDLLPGPAPSPEEAEARFYLRVTLVVALGMVAGAALEWIPAEPSPPMREGGYGSPARRHL